ncbi:MAG: N-acetyl-gamma-glutamyl-phosphate reductase [Candidatus Eisenbacteria bacterium]
MSLTAEVASEPGTPRVAVQGATGYVGTELCRLLWGHPGVELAFAGSSSSPGRRLSDCVEGAPPVPLSSPGDLIGDQIDLTFLALPAGRASGVATDLIERGCRVVDMSGDHRLKDRHLHQDVYGTSRDELLAESAVYGITEFVRPLLTKCRFVANPGCYATSVALALGPLARSGGLLDCAVSSQSGVSGAGRAPSEMTHFCTVDGDVRPYKVGVHRHAPEMTQFLCALSDQGSVEVSFVPHLVPIRRGIVSTIFARTEASADEVRALLDAAYESEPFVEVLPDGGTASVRGIERTNSCRISVHPVRGSDRVVLVSAIDNLLKGAAGQAVQNMNAALGLEETMGLPSACQTQALPPSTSAPRHQGRRHAAWVAN